VGPFKRYRDVALVILLLAVPFFFLRANIRRPEQTNFIDRGLLTVSAPIEYTFSALARGVSSLLSEYVYLVDVKRDNNRLAYQTARLQAKVNQLSVIEAENRRLRRLLGLRDRVGAETVSGLVVSKDTTDYFRVAQNRYLVPISVKIPGSILVLAKKGGKQSTDFDFIGQVREAASGRLVTGVGDNIPVKLSDSDASQLEHRYVQYDTGLTVAPGKYNLKFLVRENQTGKMGTFETNFVVPDLSALKELRMSSVILSSQVEPVKAAVGSADNDKRALANHPLIQNGQKTVPSITRVFRKNQTLYVYFEVYDPAADPAAKTPSLSAQVELLQGARKAFSSMPLRQDKLIPNRPGVTSFNFQIPLAAMASGQYTAQVNVIDEAGKRFAFPRSSIVVLP